ncbi:hypothetical protein PsorP6_014646 [Peronosclerospora sorghi]|uniref:Uncharacterized protein n=1 Tax=Peronosclerospora sorghi TaxID=230839 RepID=A0ACC0VVA7_9STRA|nr:hypothetical protein PsorP6_014646 [Peronosclerospora sorghi]
MDMLALCRFTAFLNNCGRFSCYHGNLFHQRRVTVQSGALGRSLSVNTLTRTVVPVIHDYAVPAL